MATFYAYIGIPRLYVFIVPGSGVVSEAISRFVTPVEGKLSLGFSKKQIFLNLFSTCSTLTGVNPGLATDRR
jgi:hypothetical protein